MSDIITRLLLKTNDFDTNLNNAKQSVNTFQNGISSAAQTAGAGVAKFAGAIGIAMGATEAFNKTIESTQTTGDAFVKNMDMAKASVNAFFTSIAMGNVDGFLANLGNVITKAGDLSVMLDELATKTLFSNAELNTLMLSKKVQENIAKDKTKSDKERNAALLEARSIQLQINKLQSELANTNKQSAYSTLDSAIAKQGLKGNVARSTWDYALKESSRPTLTNYANEYRARSTKVDNAKEINQSTGLLMETKESKQLKKQLDAWVKTSSGRFAEFAYYFTEMDDSLASDLGQAVEMNNKANAMKGAISDANLLLNNTDAKINGSFKKQNSGGAGSKGSTNKPAPSGLLTYFDAEIAKSSAELIKTTDTQVRAAVQATINELERQKIELLITGKDGSLEALSIQISALKNKYLSATTDGAREEIHKLITELETKVSYINGNVKAPLKKAGFSTQQLDVKGMKLPKFKAPISEDDIDINRQYAESLGSIGMAFGSMGQMATQFGSEGMAFALNSVGSIAQMIVQLQGLATANGVANAMALPFPANLGAIATVIGAVTSIFASLPAFENGGIVPGISYTGDKVHALVNSGEMILNGGQQSNLFRMLNSCGSAGLDADALTRRLYAGIDASTLCGNLATNKEAPKMGNVNMYIKPTEVSSNDAQPREACLRGSDIALALKNYNGKKSRVRGSDIYF